MRTLYLFVLFLGFSKASTLQSIIAIDDVKFKETIDKLDLNSIKSTLTEELKDVLSQYNVEQLKEELAASNNEKNGPIESVILELLERFRQIMRNGTDSLPVLDPIMIKQISLGDKTIPSSSYVLINDLVIKDISTFEVEKLQLSTVWFRPRLDFDFVIPAVSVNTIEMRTLYLFVLFLGFSKASTLQSIIAIDDVKFKETIDKLDLNSIKSTLTEELKDVLSQYNVEQLKEELAASNNEKNGPIESVILELLERFRQIMRNGTDSLPVLDPIMIKQISLGDKTIPSSSYVLINDLVIKDISTFEVEKLQLSTVWFRPRLDFDFVIPAVSVNTSSYDLFFNVFGGNIYGKGDMRLVIDKPRIFGHFILGVRVTLEGIFLRIEECRIQIGLEAFRPIITGMFGDQAISDFIAAFLRNLIPEMLEFFEKDIADTLSLVVQFVGNLILAEVNIGDLLPTS